MVDIEFGDIETFRSDKDKQFSHQALVMRVLNNCIEAGSKEMREGYFNEKSDSMGNYMKVYNEDTREKFISCVKTALSVMSCDLDEKQPREDKINEIFDKIKKEHKKLCEQEKQLFEKASSQWKENKRNEGIVFVEGYLNNELSFSKIYLNFRVDCYREILSELHRLTKDHDFFVAEVFEA